MRQAGHAVPRGAARFVAPLLAAVLLGVLGLDLVGLGMDIVSALHLPLELDYGEGIVWAQASLIPGPRAYAPGQGLPFIVFHYPPLFHLAARTLLAVTPDLLVAGRLASMIAMLVIPLAVAGLVLLAAPRNARRPDPATVWGAVIGALLVLCIHVLRGWGMLMRVDTLAVALGMLGVLAGAQANGRFAGTTLALLLCTAAVFTKQTQLAAGVAVFAVALLRDVRSALGAALVAAAAGGGVVVWLQMETGGGFLQNIVGYNINRFALKHAFWTVWPVNTSVPLMLLFAAAVPVVLLRWSRPSGRAAWSALARTWLAELRRGDRGTTTRAILLAYAGLAGVMLFTVFKSGGYFNYLLEWVCVTGTLLGIAASDVARAGFSTNRNAGLLLLLLVGAILLPARTVWTPPQALLDQNAALVREVRNATRPVASENMTVLMQAGQLPVFEPAIVTELALVNRWDEGPLVEMIRGGGFAFMVITDDTPGGTNRRTPAVDAAMRASYPRVEAAGHRLWIRRPAAD